MYQDWFLDYASYVILERAVPHINDGLKPVQRRILHSMKRLDDGRYNKVANIVGHTMQFHPHGDASIGDALVQLGQKDLLIDCQGNWGNILTGDGAAAPRYIEARLSKFALETVFNPKTTLWQLSYDGRNKEPVTLPVKFPLLLAQGVEGIAVGLSSKILPHNFNELLDASVAYLRGEEFTLYPDFQTGGYIDVSKYNDGERGGSVKVRAKITKLDNKTLVISEIPYGKTTRCEGGIYRTEDEGSSWIKMNGNLGLDLNRLSGGVPDSYYSYISEWLGIKPFEARKKFPQLPHCALQTFYMIAADPSMEGCVYIGFADPQIRNSIMPGRLWKTEDNGKLWINTARLYEETWEQDKAYWEERGNPWNENMNVGHASPHMRFGKNYALRSMRALSVGVDGSVMIVSDHSTMLSTDRGKTWNQVDEDYTETGAIIGHGNSNLPGLTIAQDLREETTLLGSGEHNLWIPEKPIECLPQKGNNLSNIPIRFINSTQPTVSCMVFDPYDVNTVYAISNRQEFKQYLFRSTDRGESWSKYGVATPATNKWLDDFYTNGFLIDPIDNNYLYFGITKIVDKNKGHLAGFYIPIITARLLLRVIRFAK